MEKRQSVTIGSLTFRWADDVLTVTTPTGHYVLTGQEASELLSYLFAYGDEMADVTQEIPSWARSPKQQVDNAASNPQITTGHFDAQGDNEEWERNHE